MQHPQRPERAADRLAALGAEQAGDAAGGDDPVDVVGGAGETEDVRVRGDEPVDELDLLERRRHRLVPGQVARDVDRPELRADHPLAQSRQVGAQARLAPDEVDDVEPGEVAADPLAQLPRQVVVAVDERVRAQDAGDPLGGRLGVGHGVILPPVDRP